MNLKINVIILSWRLSSWRGPWFCIQILMRVFDCVCLSNECENQLYGYDQIYNVNVLVECLNCAMVVILYLSTSSSPLTFLIEHNHFLISPLSIYSIRISANTSSHPGETQLEGTDKL